MERTSSKVVILAALIGNGLIAISKFFASWLTLSSSMFSEAIHSVVDVGNQILLLMGLRFSSRHPDRLHPFGYGKEIYFWSFVVAILLFAVGGGLSIYEGISHWRNPVSIRNIMVNYIVLSLAIIFESAAWYVAFNSLRKRSIKFHFIRSIHEAKDPALIVVLLEDSAALIGLFIAAIGIGASVYFEMPRLDAVASLLIGVLLILVAIWLAYESKNLLIGESADPKVVAAIRSLVTLDRNILEVKQIMTMHMGPDEVLVNLYVDFHDDISSQDIEKAINRLEEKIKKKVPSVKWVFIALKKLQ